MLLVGCGLVMWSVGALMIHLSRFTKNRDIASGLIIYKDKQTGKRYVRTGRSGYLMEVRD